MIMCMIVASTLVMPVQAQSDSTLFASIDGPSLVSIGGVNQYTITVVGGPAESTNGTYSYKVTMSGYAATNATLIPGSGTSKTGVFHLNLTTPKVLGDLTISVNATSANPNGTASNSTIKTVSVKVVNPVVFTVNIKNTGNMTVTNIPVYFYVDDNQIHLANVTVTALTTKTVSYNWTTNSLASGSHVLRVQIDPNATFVLFDVGGTVQTTTFYYNQGGYGTINALLYVSLVVLAFAVFLVYRRKAPRKKK